jgi:hypothetical protein
MSFRMAATTLLHSKSYLGGWYRHLRRQLPSYAAAIKAMARCLAVLVYRADESFWRGLNGPARLGASVTAPRGVVPSAAQPIP